jgi:RNA polymerase sigma-70 factor, ECF subfamily
MLRPPIRNRQRNLRSLADEELMLLVGNHDAGAFEVIFDRHGSAAFSLAYRMCGQRSVAEDVVQESFLSLWRTAARYEPSRGSVRSWVLSVVRNRTIDSFRTRAAKQIRDVQDDGTAERMPATESTELDAIRNEEGRDVRRALDELPPEQRQVIELAFFGGYTHLQLAEMLELPAGTIKGRMRLGLTKMRTALADPAATVL